MRCVIWPLLTTTHSIFLQLMFHSFFSLSFPTFSRGSWSFFSLFTINIVSPACLILLRLYPPIQIISSVYRCQALISFAERIVRVLHNNKIICNKWILINKTLQPWDTKVEETPSSTYFVIVNIFGDQQNEWRLNNCNLNSLFNAFFC